MPPIIVVKGLYKDFKVMQRRAGMFGAVQNLFMPRFRTIHAIDGVSFTLQEGELVGYLGPNGAGKSTTVKVLTGLLVPTSGEVLSGGLIPWKTRKKYVAQIGAVFGQRTTLWWDLPVLDSLELMQAIYKIQPERFRRNLADFVDLLEMQPFLNTPVRSLSLGQRMRADLCAALLHEPRLVFLDEPTIGLDVVAKERIRQFILHINRQRGATILLTTHDLSDVERLCERVMIIDHGRLLYDGGLSALQERFGSAWTLAVDFAEEYTNIDLTGLPPPMREGTRGIYTFDHNHQSAPDLIAILLANYKIADLEVRRPALENTIRRIYEEKLL